jgi:hypothetical protein
MLALHAVIAVALAGVRSAGAGWPGGCPCGDPLLCEPIRTPRPFRDVLAAGSQGLGAVTDNTQIDWDVVTIVADVSVDIHNSGLYCQAHKKGVRVLQDIACDMAAHGIPGVTPAGSNCVDSNGTTSNHYYNLNISDPTARQAWVVQATATVVSLGFDGVIFDTEEGVGNPPHIADPAALVAMMSELRASLRQADPSLIMGAFVGVNSTDVIATGNPYDKLVPTFDFFAVMACVALLLHVITSCSQCHYYGGHFAVMRTVLSAVLYKLQRKRFLDDWFGLRRRYDMLACTCGAGFSAPCGSNWMGDKSKHCMTAGADAPYNFVDQFIGQWLALPGMQPRQVIMVLPAVGFWFRCDSKDPSLAPGKCKIVASNR